MARKMATRNENAVWLDGQRAASGMTTSAFAVALGISRVTLWRYETRDAALPNWLRISASVIANKMEMPK